MRALRATISIAFGAACFGIGLTLGDEFTGAMLMVMGGAAFLGAVA